jgi:hypothetical protein
MVMAVNAITNKVLSELLSLENVTSPDWVLIKNISTEEISRLNETGEGQDVNGIPYQFLEDYDIRQRDAAYGDMQRRRLREYLGLL